MRRRRALRLRYWWRQQTAIMMKMMEKPPTNVTVSAPHYCASCGDEGYHKTLCTHLHHARAMNGTPRELDTNTTHNPDTIRDSIVLYGAVGGMLETTSTRAD